MNIAFFILYSLNRSQVQMNEDFLIDKEVLLYYIQFTAAMLEKIQNIVHTARVV